MNQPQHKSTLKTSISLVGIGNLLEQDFNQIVSLYFYFMSQIIEKIGKGKDSLNSKRDALKI